MRIIVFISLLSLFSVMHPVPSVANESVPRFAEITAALGFNDTTAPWADGTYALPEITGGGLALFDYDNDGDLDLLQIRCPPPNQPDAPAPNLLFQQQREGTFLDVTTAAGVGDPGYGQGVAVGDTDNDGDLDLYVTNFGPDAFYRNNGDGTFVDATAESGISGEDWSTSAAFIDFDKDGDLDLYVVHYVHFNPAIECNENTVPEYCGPQNFEPAMDTLYRNNGGGTFSEVTADVGITAPGKGLGVVCADLTGDRAADFYVANDGEVNQLWVNNGDGHFTDEAILRGAGFNAYGQPEASMGVVVGDANDDGRLDLFMTHLREETNTLYIATEYAIFSDESDASGLGMVDLPYTGFGCGFFDYDNDGDLDVAIANGRVKRGPLLPGADVGEFWNVYAEPNLLLQNNGDGGFTDASGQAGAFGTRIEVSRGLAFGDIDRDGDIDLVVGNLGGPPRIFRNDVPPPESHWLSVRALVGGRDAIGATVTVVAGGKRFVRPVLPGYSYASSSDPRVHFGLGGIDRIEAIEVTWPDGSREHFKADGVDRELTIRKGEGAQQ
jgi:hypothetical protein